MLPKIPLKSLQKHVHIKKNPGVFKMHFKKAENKWEGVLNPHPLLKILTVIIWNKQDEIVKKKNPILI